MITRAFTSWLDAYRGIPRDVWFLALVNLINRCGSMVIAFMTLYLTQQLAFTIEQAGYVLGFFGVGAFCGAYLGGWLTDAFGYRRIQFWSLILNGLMLLVIVWVRGFWPMCVAILILSLISETFRPANAVAIQRHSTPETRQRSISLYRMSVNLGWTVAPALGGVLASINWNLLFWIDGMTCMLAGLALMLLLPYKRVDSTTADAKAAGISDDINPYRDRVYWAFLAFTFLGAMVFMQLIWTIPVFFKQTYHWDEWRIGLVAALNGIIVFVVEMPLVNRLDGRRAPLGFVRTGLVLYGLSYFMFLTPLWPLLAALAFTLAISIGEIFVMPFSTNFVYGRTGAQHAGKYLGLYTMAYSVSNIVAPLLG
ncbi:MAG: MFS transporter, partial [Saprospiraceae bacterium]